MNALQILIIIINIISIILCFFINYEFSKYYKSIVTEQESIDNIHKNNRLLNEKLDLLEETLQKEIG